MLASGGEFGVSHLEKETLAHTAKLTVVVQTVAYRGRVQRSDARFVWPDIQLVGRLVCLFRRADSNLSFPGQIVAEISESVKLDSTKLYLSESAWSSFYGAFAYVFSLLRSYFSRVCTYVEVYVAVFW